MIRSVAASIRSRLASLTLIAKSNTPRFPFPPHQVLMEAPSSAAAASDSTSETPFVVREGSAEIHFKNEKEAFYNPVQEFNRDTSIAVITEFIRQYSSEERKGKPAVEKLTALEALSASGLRSVRYAKEIPGLHSVIANDYSKSAVESIKRNIVANGVGDIVTASHADASALMHSRKKYEDRFHVVDLDPYGSAVPFLDSAVQATAEGGLLCVTCTDMGVLCGNAPETGHSKYGAIPLKSKCCHEMALRIVLQSIESHANKYGRYIEPLLSLSIDFYCRLFVRIRTGPKQVKKSTSKLGHVFKCTGCDALSVQPLGRVVQHDDGKNLLYKLCTGPPVDKKCTFCDHPHYIGGPMWIAPIHDKSFVTTLLDRLEDDELEAEAGRKKFGTHDRMKGMLSVVGEELEDVPFYYTQDRLCSLVRAASAKLLDFRSAILNAGYRVSLSHANKLAIKTDAPTEFIFDMMHAWEKKNPVNMEKLPKGSVAWTLLHRVPKHEVSFELHPDANPESRARQLKRFQQNPEKNWGPKARSTAGSFEDDAKRVRNQGRKRRKKGGAETEADDGGEGSESAEKKSKDDQS